MRVWIPIFATFPGTWDPMTIHRYAIYYGPRPGTPLYGFGRHWFGTDPETAEPVPIRLPAGLDTRTHQAVTDAPRRYGLHGTLKPPFRLAAGTDRVALERQMSRLAASHAPVPLGPPVLTRLGSFLALCPRETPPALAALAAACVKDLDEFRAPPSAEEVRRRRAADLSPRQEALLQRWGYPYVMEEFRFHVTVTGPLSPSEQTRMTDVLQPLLRHVLTTPMTIDDLCLYGEPSDGSPFRILARVPLGGA